MAQLVRTKVTQYTLTLSEEEVEWLKKVLRSPIRFECSTEDVKDKRRRFALYTTLS